MSKREEVQIDYSFLHEILRFAQNLLLISKIVRLVVITNT
jgi:hypothetical protein